MHRGRERIPSGIKESANGGKHELCSRIICLSVNMLKHYLFAVPMYLKYKLVHK